MTDAVHPASSDPLPDLLASVVATGFDGLIPSPHLPDEELIGGTRS